MSAKIPPELSEELDFPSIFDRLPDFAQKLKSEANALQQAPAHQSYLPYWESIYKPVHALKGSLGLLACPVELRNFILQLNSCLVAGIREDKIVTNLAKAGSKFMALASKLERLKEETVATAGLKEDIESIVALYETDLTHSERASTIPPKTAFIDEFTSKKIREMYRLGLCHFSLHEKMMLEQLPVWNKSLEESLVFSEGGRGLVINYLPMLRGVLVSQFHVWAWVACEESHAEYLLAILKQKFPKANFSLGEKGKGALNPVTDG